MTLRRIQTLIARLYGWKLSHISRKELCRVMGAYWECSDQERQRRFRLRCSCGRRCRQQVWACLAGTCTAVESTSLHGRLPYTACCMCSFSLQEPPLNIIRLLSAATDQKASISLPGRHSPSSLIQIVPRIVQFVSTNVHRLFTPTVIP